MLSIYNNRIVAMCDHGRGLDGRNVARGRHRRQAAGRNSRLRARRWPKLSQNRAMARHFKIITQKPCYVTIKTEHYTLATAEIKSYHQNRSASSLSKQRSQLTFGIDGIAHRWFHSYLSSRKQYVRWGPSRSSVTYLTCGVPQGSVIGPILFVLYTVDLLSVIDNHGLSPHMYADDTQVYCSCKPTAITAFTAKISECVQAATSWMRSNRLQPNPELYAFCLSSYAQPSFLFFGLHVILSQEGPQQGDPLAPLLFCTTVHPLISSLSSDLTAGYLDDLTLAGP